MDGKKINDLAKLHPATLKGQIISGKTYGRGKPQEAIQETINTLEAVRQAVSKITDRYGWNPVFQEVHKLPGSHTGWNRSQFMTWFTDQSYRATKSNNDSGNRGKKKKEVTETEVAADTAKKIHNLIIELRYEAKRWEANGGFERVAKEQGKSRGMARHNRIVKAALARSEVRVKNEEHLSKINHGTDAEKKLKKLNVLAQELRDQKQDPINEGQVLAITSAGYRISYVAQDLGVKGLRVSREGSTKNSRKMDRLHSTYDQAANAILEKAGQNWGIDRKVIEGLKFKSKSSERRIDEQKIEKTEDNGQSDLYKPQLPMGVEVAKDFSNVEDGMQVKMFGNFEVTIHVKHFRKEDPIKFSVWDRRHNPNLKKTNPVFAVWKGAVDYAFKIWKEDSDRNP